MILVDTSAIIAALSRKQREHEACARALRDSTPPRILSPFVLAELDYFIQKYSDVDTELRFLTEVSKRVYELAPFSPEDIDKAIVVIDQYRELHIGLADASIVVLAERYGSRDILTLDERHFRALRPPGRRTFRIFPADA